MVERANRLPVDRRHHDPAERGGLDPPSGQTRRRLLPHERGPLAELGGRNEGNGLEGSLKFIQNSP